jgi:hypothetical protein
METVTKGLWFYILQRYKFFSNVYLAIDFLELSGLQVFTFSGLLLQFLNCLEL